jgi:hypothetical protein
MSRSVRNHNNKINALKFIQENEFFLKIVSDEFKNDIDVVAVSVKQNGLTLEFASESLRNDDDIVSIACRSNIEAIQFASDRLKSDVNMFNMILENDFSEEALFYFDHTLLSNEELMLRAIKKSENHWLFVADQLKYNDQFIEKALRENINILKHLFHFQIRDIEMAKIAIKESIEFLTFLDPKLKENRELLMFTISKCHGVDPLVYFDQSFADDDEIAFALLYKNNISESFKGLSRRLKENENIVYQALKLDGLLLAHVPSKFRQDKKLVCIAVSQNGLALEYADRKLRADKDVVLLAIYSDYTALGFADDILWLDRDIIKAALRKGLLLTNITNHFNKDLELIKIAVANQVQNYLYLPTALQKNLDIIKIAIQHDGSILKHLSADLRNDPMIVREAIKNSFYALEYASSKLRNDRDFILSVLDHLYDLEHISNTLKKDKEFMSMVVQHNGRLLKYASTALKKDAEFVLLAIANQASAYEYADQSLLSSRDFILKALEISGSIFEYLNEDLKHDKTFAIIALKNNVGFDQIPLSLKKDPDILKIAIRNPTYQLTSYPIEVRRNKNLILDMIMHSSDRNSFNVIDERLKDDFNILLEFVISNHRQFEYFPEKFKDDERFVLIVLKEKGSLLQFVSPRLKKDDIVVMTAVLNDANALEFAHPSFRKNKEIMMLALSKSTSALAFIDESLKTDPDILALLEKHDFKSIEMMSSEQKKDKDLMLKMLKKNIHDFSLIDPSLKTEEFILSLDEDLLNVNLIPLLNFDLLKNRSLILKLLKGEKDLLNNDINYIYQLYVDDDEVVKALLKYPLFIDFSFIEDHPDLLLIAIMSQRESFEYASNKLKYDISFVQKALEINPHIFEYIPKELMILHPEIFQKYILIHSHLYHHLPIELQNDERFNMYLIENSKEVFKHLPIHLKKKDIYQLYYLYGQTKSAYQTIAQDENLMRELCLLAKQKNDISLDIFNHIETFYMIVAKQGNHEIKLPMELRKNISFARRFIPIKANTFKQFETFIRYDDDIAFSAIVQDENNIYECSPMLLENKELLSAAILLNPKILKKLPYEITSDWLYAGNLLSKNGELLEYFPAYIRYDSKLIEIATRHSKNAIKYALDMNMFVMRKVLVHNSSFYDFIPLSIKISNHQELMEIINRHSNITIDLDAIPYRLKNDALYHLVQEKMKNSYSHSILFNSSAFLCFES